MNIQDTFLIRSFFLVVERSRSVIFYKLSTFVTSAVLSFSTSHSMASAPLRPRNVVARFARVVGGLPYIARFARGFTARFARLLASLVNSDSSRAFGPDSLRSSIQTVPGPSAQTRSARSPRLASLASSLRSSIQTVPGPSAQTRSARQLQQLQILRP